MFQTDQPTAVSSLPTPATAGTQGYFTNGNPATGTPATILDADFMNMVMMELLNIVTAGGLTPSKTTNNQVLTAIKTLMQQSAPTIAVDTGTANTYVIAFAPVWTAPVPWAPFWFKVKTANNGASTLNATGTAYGLVGGAHQALQGGELVANGNALAYFNPTLNGGAGQYVLILCSGAAEQVAPATQPAHAPQMGQLQTQSGTAFTTGGTAPNFTLTPSPAIQSYAANQRFRVQFNAAGTTASNTLNISGKGAINLMQYGPDGVLVPAVITANLLTDVEYNGTYMVVLDPVAVGFAALQPLAASVASNALTLTLNPTALAFRSATLTSGASVPLSIGSALSLVVPSGATLGTTSGVAAQLALLVAYNAGTPVLCVANMAGGLNLDETTLISPTTISSSANSASTIYSAAAVAANSPFRVVGYINITEATAGTWATAPTLVQGLGGQAMAAMQSLGFGQTWQSVTRSANTTYYNTTGRPIVANVVSSHGTTNSYSIMTINGVQITGNGDLGTSGSTGYSWIIPAGASYSIAASSGTINLGTWSELR